MLSRNTKNRPGSRRGFTLIEMLVAMMIFSVVAVIAAGSLVRIVAVNRRAQALQSAMNNVAFALESMSREMRVGSDYDCQNNPNGAIYNGGGKVPSYHGCSDSSGFRFIGFSSSKTADAGGGKTCNLAYAYRFRALGTNPETYHLEKAEQTACNSAVNDSDFASILDDGNIILTGYKLGVFKSGTYAIGFVRLTGYAGIANKISDQTPFDLQTAFSQRIAD